MAATNPISSNLPALSGPMNIKSPSSLFDDDGVAVGMEDVILSQGRPSAPQSTFPHQRSPWIGDSRPHLHHQGAAIHSDLPQRSAQGPGPFDGPERRGHTCSPGHGRRDGRPVMGSVSRMTDVVVARSEIERLTTLARAAPRATMP